MKKINIIQKNTEFERIIKSNQSFKYKYFIIYLEKNEHISPYKFGISVSKKVINAVGRNKIKRQLKDIIDKNNYQNNFNCIIIVRKEILFRSYNEIKEDLNEIFKKLNILKGEKNEK